MLRHAVAGALAVSTLTGCSGGGDAPRAAHPATHTDTVQSAGTAARVIEECPELPERCAAVTRWVARVVERAGYRVSADTGGVLIATGQGRQSFHAWAIRVSYGVPRCQLGDAACLSGVRLLGRKHRRWWLTQGFAFWIEAGPFAHSILPPRSGLSGLIEASLALAPPKTQRRG
jgi:hypothetical protein